MGGHGNSTLTCVPGENGTAQSYDHVSVINGVQIYVTSYKSQAGSRRNDERDYSGPIDILVHDRSFYIR